MTDLEAMKRMELMSYGGTNFSEKNQTACKIALEALQERRTIEAELHSYKAMLETAKELIAKQKAEIDRLALVNDDLRVQVEGYDKDDLKWADGEIEKLKQELAKVARERYAAVRDLWKALKDDPEICNYCANGGDGDNCKCIEWVGREGFEWRGVKEE